MRRTMVALALIALAIGGLTTVAVASVGTRADKAAPADQIRQAEQALLRAAVDADSAAAGRLLAPDFQLIDPFGAPESRKTYLDAVAGDIDFVTLRTLSPIRVRLYGNAAITRFQEAFEIVAGPDRLKHRGWTTNLFERRNGQWLLGLVADHGDAEQPGPPRPGAQGSPVSGSTTRPSDPACRKEASRNQAASSGKAAVRDRNRGSGGEPRSPPPRSSRFMY